MSNIAKAQRMMEEGKSLELISKALGLSVELLEGMRRNQASASKPVDRSFMPRSFVKKDFTVLPVHSSPPVLSEEERQAQEKARAKAAKEKRAYEVLRYFIKVFPKLFSVKDPKPLALGVHKDIFERVEKEGITKKEISKALGRYITRKAYFQCVIEGGDRYDLDGNKTGKVGEEHIEEARKKLKRKFSQEI